MSGLTVRAVVLTRSGARRTSCQVAPPAASGPPTSAGCRPGHRITAGYSTQAGQCSSEGAAPPSARYRFARGTYERRRAHPCARTAPSPATSQREWLVIDATDIVLGRLAVQTANLLRGKHKPIFAPHVDTGDFVIIINAEKVALSGNKKTTKMAYRHSGYPGGLSATPIGELLEKDARKAIENAVWGMLPKNRLGRQMLKKLKVYSGPNHPHQAQQAMPFEIIPDLPVIPDDRAET